MFPLHVPVDYDPATTESTYNAASHPYHRLDTYIYPAEALCFEITWTKTPRGVTLTAMQ